VIARDRGRRGEEKRNRGTDKWRADGCNGDLSGRESDGAGDQADKNRADFTLAAVVGSEPRGDTNELCGVPRYVAHAQYAFLWNTEAGSLRHIFLHG